MKSLSALFEELWSERDARRLGMGMSCLDFQNLGSREFSKPRLWLVTVSGNELDRVL